MASEAPLVDAIVSYLNWAFDQWPVAVASSLQHTQSGTIFLARNVTVPLDNICVEIPPLKSLKVCSKGQRRRIRCYIFHAKWTTSLRWLREYLDKVANAQATHARAVFGLGEGALVRFENVNVEGFWLERKPKILSVLGFHQGRTSLRH